MKRALPPPGTLLYDGAPVRTITRAPDGRFYLARDGASTVIVERHDLAEIEVR